MDVLNVDIANKFFVGTMGQNIKLYARTLTKEEAAVLAGWLILLSGISDDELTILLDRMRST